MEALLSSRDVSDYFEDRKGLSDKANDAVISLIKSDKPWLHHFEDPSSRNLIEGCEFKDEDCEASILSKSLFYYLLNIAREIGAISDAPPTDKPFSLEKCNCKKGEATYPNKLLFHFDVMNTSNAFTGNRFEYDWKIGVMAMRKDVALRFPSIRYTIGNFAPLPWWITRISYSNGLQGLHNGLSEWWDMLLLYLQWRMDEFADKNMSFVDYIIFTCQFFYIENLRRAGHDKDLFKGLYTGDITAEEFCNKIENDKGCASGKPWTEHIKSWSKTLHRSKSIRILSLMSVGSDAKINPLKPFPKHVSAKKRNSKLFTDSYWDADPGECRNVYVDDKKKCRDPRNLIHQTDELICRLIEVRGRCIMELLKENISMLEF